MLSGYADRETGKLMASDTPQRRLSCLDNPLSAPGPDPRAQFYTHSTKDNFRPGLDCAILAPCGDEACS